MQISLCWGAALTMFPVLLPLNSISGTGKGKAAGSLGSTLPWTFPKNLLRLFLTSERYFYLFVEVIFETPLKDTVEYHFGAKKP